MNKIALAGAALTALVPLGLAAPAQAAAAPTSQKICSSSATRPVDVPIYVQEQDVYPGGCVEELPGPAVIVQGESFRVAYNYGDYQGCQNAPKSIEHTSRTPNVIYFKVYAKNNCTN